MSADRYLWSELVPARLAVAAAPAIAAWCRDRRLGRPMLVGGPSLSAAPRGIGLVHALEAAGLALWTFDRASAPSLSVVAEAVAGYHFEGCDAVVAIGGGVAMEVAKGAALMAGQRHPYRAMAVEPGADGDAVDPSAIPPLLMVPTTASAAIAVGAVVWIADETGAARPVRHPALRPAEAILAEDFEVRAAVGRRSLALAALIAADAAVPDDQLVRTLDSVGRRGDLVRAGLALAAPVEAATGPRRRLALTAAAAAGLDFAAAMSALTPPGAIADQPDWRSRARALCDPADALRGWLPDGAMVRAARAACGDSAAEAELDRVLAELGVSAGDAPRRRGRRGHSGGRAA
jgi:hypothetical protein